MTAIPILLEREGLVVVDKPPGISVIPGRGSAEGPSLRERIEAQLGRKVWVVHRLDRDTSGALVFALDAETHRVLSVAFEAGQVKKRYLALVEGRLEAPQRIELALVPARRGRMRPVKPGEVGKESTTLVRPLERFTGSTLLEAEPLTGRTHQIRVHLRSIGHPLLVDHQYGRSEPFVGPQGGHLLARTPLHACRVEWPTLPSLAGGGVDAPLAPDMERAVRSLTAS